MPLLGALNSVEMGRGIEQELYLFLQQLELLILPTENVEDLRRHTGRYLQPGAYAVVGKWRRLASPGRGSS
jgi:hypothetical protein